MSKITQLARHAADHKYQVVIIGMKNFDNPAFSNFAHIPEFLETIVKTPKACVILDVFETLSTANSITLASDIGKNFERIQSVVDASRGCLALASRELNQTCVVYPPTSPITLDIDQFYSPDVARLVRAVFSPTHALVQWLDYTEAHIQKQHIIQQLPAATNTTRKKM